MRLPLSGSSVTPSRCGLLAFATLLAIGFATPALAQTDAVLGGRVSDVDGNPIANAEVIISSTVRGDQRSLRTDADGDYYGRGFRSEVYRVRFQAPGYDPQEQEIKINFGTNTVDARLEVAAIGPDVDLEALNALYQEGFAAFRAEEWTVAAAAMGALIEGIEGIQDDEADVMRKSAYEVLGRAHLELGNSEDAVGAYEALIALDPESFPAYVWLAQTYVRNGDFDRALPYLRRAAELAPDDAGTQYNAGAMLLQTNNVEEGIALVERAIELRPEFPLAHKTLAYAYLRTENYTKAIELLKKYLEQAPDAPDKADVEGMIETLEAQIQQ